MPAWAFPRRETFESPIVPLRNAYIRGERDSIQQKQTPQVRSRQRGVSMELVTSRPGTQSPHSAVLHME